MKKPWIIGLVLFVSVALNMTLASMLIGKQASQQFQPMHMALDMLDDLPEASRKKATDILMEDRLSLSEKMQEFLRSRQNMKAYLASDEYRRKEAEKKLAELRQKTTTLQEAAQAMILDIVDSLPPEERAAILKKDERME